MKPVKFKGYNVIFAKDQEPYLPLPAYVDNRQGGRVFHCWQLSIKERIEVLLTGKLWIKILNFKQPLQPIRPMSNNPFKRL